jgi:hypothetical protein
MVDSGQGIVELVEERLVEAAQLTFRIEVLLVWTDE